MPKTILNFSTDNPASVTTDYRSDHRLPEFLPDTSALQDAVFNSAKLSCIATDAKGVIQIFNVGAEHMLGYAAGDVVNQITLANISDAHEVSVRAELISREFGLPITSGFEALAFKAAQGIEDVYELTFIRKDGSRAPTDVSLTALRDTDSKVMGYLIIGTANTARKQVEYERGELEQRLRDQQFYTHALFESSNDALMVIDPSGVISDVNKHMEALTACAREELLGAQFKSFFTDPGRAEAAIEQVLTDKKIADYELTARAKDGKETVVSCNATTFCDRIGRLMGVFAGARDITRHKQAEKQILHLALHDSLTQLPNRRLLNERLGQAMATSKRSGRYGALTFLDMDNFKALNDKYGHTVGDLLLIEVSRRICSCVREVDIVARFGGDEFVVILSDLDENKSESVRQAGIVAEKIRAILNLPYVLKIKPDGKDETTVEYHCTSSIGVALFLDHEVGTEEVIRWADIAMYQAKEAGGNSIHFFDS